MKTMKKWPAPTASAFFAASDFRLSSFPSTRTRHGPDASQNATPNLIPGTDPMSASWMSSAVLMKCVWPRITFNPLGYLDRDEFRLDRHRQCIGPRELSLLLAEVEVRYVHAEGTGIGIASESHGGNQGVVDDPRQRRRPGGARGPRARGDGDSSALREPRRSGTFRRGIHGDPVPAAGLAPAATAWSARGARSASRVPGPRRQLDQGLRGRRPAACARGHRPRARRMT